MNRGFSEEGEHVSSNNFSSSFLFMFLFVNILFLSLLIQKFL